MDDVENVDASPSQPGPRRSDSKGKRGRQPENLASDQTLDFPAAAVVDDVYAGNADASSYQPGSRHKKPSKISPEELPALAASYDADAEMDPLDSDAVNWESIANAVVKVFCVQREPNYLSPWQYTENNSSTSGFVISGKRVLTTAHSVKHCTEVKLKKRVSDATFPAKVLAISIECDIAMLTVDEDDFWEGISPLEFVDSPAICDSLTFVGYTIGGNTISLASGVVSRIEFLSYVHGSTELMRLQTDAAINFDNSGGPACNSKGNCVGIAFKSQKHGDDKTVGYVIPTPIITHFIQDYEKNGKYTGFPILGVKWQTMENPSLRMIMGMKTDQTGVRVRKIDPTAPVSKVLKESDIILSFDGFDIGNDGKVPFCHGERIRFSHFVSQRYDGDVVAMKVLRNSQIRDLNIKLESGRGLIPAYVTGKPSYYIVAGFVFTVLSAHYLDFKYGKDYENKTRVKLLGKLLQRPYDEQVLVSQVLPVVGINSDCDYKDMNSGYEDIIGNTQVIAFNGKKVKNLKSIVTMVESCDEEFLKFELELHQLVLLGTESAKAATRNILDAYCIPSAMSDDLKPEDHHIVS